MWEAESYGDGDVGGAEVTATVNENVTSTRIVNDDGHDDDDDERDATRSGRMIRSHMNRMSHTNRTRRCAGTWSDDGMIHARHVGGANDDDGRDGGSRRGKGNVTMTTMSGVDGAAANDVETSDVETNDDVQDGGRGERRGIGSGAAIDVGALKETGSAEFAEREEK